MSESEQVTGEVERLQQALDESYAKFRANALAEWQRRHPEGDPSDACVRVRIRQIRPQQTLSLDKPSAGVNTPATTARVDDFI